MSAHRLPELSTPLPELSALLRCVVCGGELATLAGGDFLRCRSCRRLYPVVDATPRMMVGPAADGLSDRTAAGFTYEWQRFGKLREEWGRNFADYLAPVRVDELRGRLLLDVGTGSGRHSFHAAAAGALVVATDAGGSIDVARRNLPPEVLTVQADARALPFAPGAFDVVICIGVLHHLPDPDVVLERIAALARPDGRVHIYVYWLPESRVQRLLLLGVSAARRLTTRLPYPVLHALCYPISLALLIGFVAPYRISRRRLPRLARALPLKAYADYPFGVLVNDQFDRFSAPIERRYTRQQVVEMMTRAGLQDIVVVENHGWVADGRRPSEPSIPAA